MARDSKNQIAELKVSGHTMALEPGLYCVFCAPDSPPPAATTGLPGVRISAAPGESGGQVSVVGFDADGWVGPNAATLVRVTDAPANLLVTVYQAADGAGAAPSLQVVLIAGGEGAAAAGAAVAPVPGNAVEQSRDRARQGSVEVVGHVYGRGDVGGRLGAWLGEPGSKRWIEGFGISPLDGIPPADIEYQAVLGRGWLSPWSSGGEFCGSRGMSLPILGLRVRLRGASAETHRVELTATFVDGSRVGPVGQDEACEAPSLAALEAFQVSIAATAAPASAGAPKAPAAGRAGVAKHAPAKTGPAKGVAKTGAAIPATLPQTGKPKSAPKAAPIAAPKPGPKAAAKTVEPPPAAKRSPATRRR